MEQKINERLREIMEKNGLNYRSFGKKLGYSDVAIAKLINGKSKPKFDFLLAILESDPLINPEWLLTGTGDMLKTETKPVDNSGLQECLAEKERLQSDIEMLKQSLKVNHKYIANLEKENKKLKATLKKLQAVNKDQPKEQSGHT